MQTALLCVLIVAACFAILIVNSGRNPKNTAVEQQIASQDGRNADAAREPETGQNTARTGESRRAPESRSNADRQSSRGAGRQKTESSDVRQSAGGGQSAGKKARESEAPKTTSSSAVKPLSSVKPSSSAPVPSAKPSSGTQLTPPVKPSSLPDIPEAVNGAKLVFVFDDAGQSLSQLEKFVSLPFPITVSVLPKLAHSKACADKVRASGNEVMLHQPMQAVNLNVNPGPGAVTADMQTSSIEALIKENIAEIGPVAGINNHEGSLISEDEMKIGAAMLAAKESGVFFLDSRTTSQTRVPQAAMALGIPYYSRNVFLDNTKDRDKIIRELMRGVDIANANGAAIMIGHIWSADILPGILIEFYPSLKNKGYRFTTVSDSGALIRP